MSQPYKILYRGGSGELVEKKSRFIATLRPVNSAAEAEAFIAEIRKKYWDARHHCFAYVIGERQEIQRMSDDGEPSQTAGPPILEVLLGSGLHNACAVVTRYFGGTLLGTGGLVRAYSGAVKEGLAACEIVEKRFGERVMVTVDYSGAGRVKYLLEQREIAVLDCQYTDRVTFAVLIPAERVEAVVGEITEATGGRALAETEGEAFYGVMGGKIVML